MKNSIMQALFFDNELLTREIPVPEPAEGEVLIKILYSAICSTDLEIIKGYMGFRGVLGHEFTGKVLAPGQALDQKTVVGGFSTIYYWSSSEGDSDTAWAQKFTNGGQMDYPKDTTLPVRAVRAF